MSYCIIGGGPVGLSLAYVLANNNYDVVLIERDSKLGGSWKNEWVDGLYFSENSPRVLIYTSYMKRFFNEIGLTSEDFGKVYGSYPNMIIKFIYFFYNIGFKITDIFVFISEYLKYLIKNSNITVETWLKQTRFSDGAKRAIRIFCILICDRSDNTNLQDFFGTIGPKDSGGRALQQFREPDKWHTLIYNHLVKMPNVRIYLNTEAVQLYERNGTITGIRCNTQGEVFDIPTYKTFLCTQSNNIIDVIESGSELVKNNWNSYEWLKNWCETTYYIGFGFSLHFKEHVEFPYQWCWSCSGDWTVIILPVSHWLKTPSRDPEVKTVWSCCIVDMDSPSSATGKTANQSTRDEVITECLRQINSANPIPEPYKITTNSQLRREGDVWMSGKTGFSRKTAGYLPIRGKIDNLFALGSFTELKGNYVIATFGRSIEAVVRYLNEYEPNLKGFHNPQINWRLVVIILITLIVIYLMMKRRT